MRPAPEGWVWAKTLEEAKAQILAWADAEEEWTHASLDHDLGASESAGVLARGDSKEGSGYDLVEWMCDEERLPTDYIRVHSWNPAGALRMRFMLERYTKLPVIVKPYVV